MIETAKPPVPQSHRCESWRAIFLAVLLGLLAGFVHGWNLSLAALLILVVFFNVRARLFFAIWLLGVVLSWLLVPMSYAVGRFALDRTPLGDLFGLLGDTGVVSLFGLDRYTIVGGGIIAVLLAIPAFYTIRNAIQRLRRKATPDAPVAHTISVPRRLLRWLLSFDDSTPANHTGATLVRPLGLWAALIGTGVISMAVWWIVPRRVETALLASLRDVNGAGVTAARVDLDFWGGRLQIDNLSFSQATEPAEDWLHIESAAARFDVIAMLQGRVSIDQLEIDGLVCQLPEQLPRPVQVEGDSIELTDTAKAIATVDGPAGTSLVDPVRFLKNWPQVELQLSRLQSAFRLLERGQEIDDVLRTAQRQRRWFGMSYLNAARSPLGLRRPTVFVRSIAVTGLPAAWGVGADAALQMSNVTSNAVLSPRPTQMDLFDGTRGKLSVVLNLRDLPRRHRVELKLNDLCVADQLISASSAQPIVCEAGKAVIHAAGWIGQKEVHLNSEAQFSALSAQISGQLPIAGLAVDHWNEALAVLPELTIRSQITGTLKSLQVRVLTAQLRDEVAQRLRQRGEKQLASVFVPAVSTGGPTARILATRPISSEPLAPATSIDSVPITSSASGSWQAQSEVSALPHVPPGASRVRRLPAVANPVSAALSETPVSITFTPPSENNPRAAETIEPVVCDLPSQVTPPERLKAPWGIPDPTADNALAQAQSPNRRELGPSVTTVVPNDAQVGASPAQRGSMSRWTDETVSKLATLFKVSERPTAAAATENSAPGDMSEPSHESTQAEPRLSAESSKTSVLRPVIR
jgi:uncharacterized protein (TIGR03546 family)